MSPQLKSVELAGIAGIKRKSDPSQLSSVDFFNQLDGPKQKFGQLINAAAEQMAFIPSAAYGLANALNNVHCRPGQTALTIQDEFPSDFFALKKWTEKNQARLITIAVDPKEKQRGQIWNEKIIEAINEQTAVVNISAVHWMDGTRFDLAAIGQACKRVGAKLIVDGTQAVGAMSIDVQRCQIDVLICAAYKWLLGPYSIGLAYYHPDFNDGEPIEESWANRSNAMDFSRLSEYSSDYFPGATRFSVGEKGNFILLPMLNAALQQVVDWGPANIQAYCKALTAPLIQFAKENDWPLEEEAFRCAHIFGLKLPESVSSEQLLADCKHRKIITSVRGTSIRISPHVYNEASDVQALVEVLKMQL